VLEKEYKKVWCEIMKTVL